MNMAQKPFEAPRVYEFEQINRTDSVSGECPVCLELLTTDSVVELPCYHLLCSSCLAEMLMKFGNKLRCPLCRFELCDSASTASHTECLSTSAPQTGLNDMEVEALQAEGGERRSRIPKRKRRVLRAIGKGIYKVLDYIF